MILVTGGLGYIGSHICLELAKQNKEFCILDNLSNSFENILDKLEKLTGRKIKFYKADLTNIQELYDPFIENKIDYVIHLAGKKSVIESIDQPDLYYENNVLGTINLLYVMKKFSCKNIIFSSSAAIYGNANPPIDEDTKLNSLSPYARSKEIVEDILKDYTRHRNYKFNVICLRYFNPLGNEETGTIGDMPPESNRKNSMNVLQYIIDTALGKQQSFRIYGNEFETKDGTSVRDFIHVVDLAKAYIKAIELIDISMDRDFFYEFNIGTGKGHTILELLETFKKVNNVEVPYIIESARKGEVPISYTNISRANIVLDWKPEKDLEDMCRDAYRFAINYNKLTNI